jgi:hypothetical protein
LHLTFLPTAWRLRIGCGLGCLLPPLLLLFLPLARPLLRRLLLLLLFALRRLRHNEGRVERRGVHRTQHDGGEDRPRQ